VHRVLRCVVVGADALNVEAVRPSSPRGLDVPEVGRLNGGCGGLCDAVSGGGVGVAKAALGETGDREPDRRLPGPRDNVDGELSASSAIDLTMYGTTPAARGMVRRPV